MRIAILTLGAWLTFGAAAMPAEPDPAAGAPDPATIAACTAKGGEMKRVGLSGSFACVIPYKDACKACITGEDCDGDCWSSSTEPGADGKVHGWCQPTNMPFGCHARVENGAVPDGILCAD